MSGLESFEETLAATLEEHRSELVLTTCAGSADICLLAKSVGVPSVSWVQDVGEDGHEAFGASAGRRIYASRYLRQFFAPGEDDSTVFYPPFQSLPLLPPARARTVLMVNAIPEKGSNVFLALARAYPDLEFVALTGWRRPEWVDSAPANAVCLERALDPIPAYRSADVVLVPSPVPEGFGRVAVEAALLGRRILCHASGGLDEAAGLSENLLPDTDPQTWISALSSVLAEGGARWDVLRRSREHAKRFVRPVAAEFLRMTT
jgi:glycosyltransferase involved in cell wall biosynthesis